MESPGAWSPDRLMLSNALRNRWSSTAAIRRSCSSTAEITARTASRSGAESVESAPSVDQVAALSKPPRAVRHRVESAGASQLKRLMTSKVRRNCWPFTVAGASVSGWPVDPVSCPARSAAQTGRASRNAASIDLVQVMATRIGEGRWLQGRPRKLWTRSRSRSTRICVVRSVIVQSDGSPGNHRGVWRTARLSYLVRRRPACRTANRNPVP